MWNFLENQRIVAECCARYRRCYMSDSKDFGFAGEVSDSSLFLLSINYFYSRPILRVLRKREELGLVAVIWYLMDNYHVSPFLNALWATVFGALPKSVSTLK